MSLQGVAEATAVEEVAEVASYVREGQFEVEEAVDLASETMEWESVVELTALASLRTVLAVPWGPAEDYVVSAAIVATKSAQAQDRTETHDDQESRNDHDE